MLRLTPAHLRYLIGQKYRVHCYVFVDETAALSGHGFLIPLSPVALQFVLSIVQA